MSNFPVLVNCCRIMTVIFWLNSSWLLSSGLIPHDCYLLKFFFIIFNCQLVNLHFVILKANENVLHDRQYSDKMKAAVDKNITWKFSICNVFGLLSCYLTHWQSNNNLNKVFLTSTWTNIAIIYHDFLPPLSRGCHVKSDNTHTHAQSSTYSP